MDFKVINFWRRRPSCSCFDKRKCKFYWEQRNCKSSCNYKYQRFCSFNRLRIVIKSGLDQKLAIAQIVLTFEGPENCRFFLYYVNSEYVQNSNVSYINNFLQTAIQSTGKYEYTITLDVVALPPAVIIDYTIAYAISIASGGGRTGQPLTLSSPTTLQIAFYFQSV